MKPREDSTGIWDRTAAEAAPDLSPIPLGRVDVAIVGGGYTGLATALFCAERGLSAHVLEAETLGFGGSGRNVGLVNAGVWHPPAAVRQALGETYGPRFVERFGDGPRRVFDLIERHQIRCSPVRNGTIHAAHAPSGMAGLEARFAEWQRLGAPVELLDRTRMAELTGSRAFFGGLFDARAGTINPLAYVHGLARAALGAGAAITPGARATRLRKDGEDWVVESSAGSLRARSVVLATNAYTDELWPGLARDVTPIDYFQLATGPLGERVHGILTGGQGLWDTGKIMRSLRRDAEDRLVLGSMGRIFGTPEWGLSQRWAARQLAQFFPDLGPVRFESAWDGRIAMTRDYLPRIHQLDATVFTPIGYNGRGITTGTLFGEAIAGLLAGDDPGELPLPVTRLRQASGGRVRSAFYATAFAANQVWRAL